MKEIVKETEIENVPYGSIHTLDGHEEFMCSHVEDCSLYVITGGTQEWQLPRPSGIFLQTPEH
jgi:hypothetical protein